MNHASLNVLPTQPQTINVCGAQASQTGFRTSVIEVSGPTRANAKAASNAPSVRAKSVALQPFTRLDHWSIYRVYFSDGTASSHLVGVCDDEARVTSAVINVYPKGDYAVTESGRIYLLGDGVRCNGQAGQLFINWLRNKGAIKVIDQTTTLLAMQKANNQGGQNTEIRIRKLQSNTKPNFAIPAGCVTKQAVRAAMAH